MKVLLVLLVSVGACVAYQSRYQAKRRNSLDNFIHSYDAYEKPQHYNKWHKSRYAPYTPGEGAVGAVRWVYVKRGAASPKTRRPKVRLPPPDPDWPQYIPPVRFFKPALDEPPARID